MVEMMKSNPFKPGDSAFPPYLAGREEEQEKFRGMLVNLADGDRHGANIVMYGPRGMGKTTLLTWLEKEVKKTAMKESVIRVSSASPDELKTPHDMWSYLLSKNLKNFFKPSQWNLHLKIISATFKEQAVVNPALKKRLIKECNKRPLVFLVDEAHTMEVEQCRSLLNLSQKVRKEAPFLLVLAGTPKLIDVLKEMESSFIERCEKIGIARLNKKSSADAIVNPLKEHGIKISTDALETVVEDSQCYPYFIQLWGSALWDVAKENDFQELTAKEVSIVQKEIEGERNLFYKERRSSLQKSGILKMALNCAEAFQEQKLFKENEIENIIKASLPDHESDEKYKRQVLEDLVRHDFVWNPPGSDLYEAGIPSLMTYVLDREQENIQQQSPQELPSNGKIDINNQENDPDHER